MMFYGRRTCSDREPPRRMPVRLRPLFTALFVASAALALTLPHAAAAGVPVARAAATGPASARYRAGEVVVRFSSTAGAAARAAAAHAAGVGAPQAFAP